MWPTLGAAARAAVRPSPASAALAAALRPTVTRPLAAPLAAASLSASRTRSTLARSDGRFIRYKPVTNGLRHKRDVDMDALGVWQGEPEASLVVIKKRTGGRNHHGRITVRGRGGGPLRVIRQVDFLRRTPGPQTVQRIEFDPFRSAFLALLKHNTTGKLSYIIAPQGVKAGDVLYSYRTGIPEELANAEPGMASPVIQVGNCLQIKDIPVGTTIHCVGLRRWGPAIMCRSAGSSGQVISTSNDGYAQIRLQSGEVRLIHVRCVATIGSASNPDWMHRVLGSAGASRNRGRRPKVRGVAKNPSDHPHGGGEGKTKGKIPVTPWGVPTKGYKTRRKAKPTWWIVKERPRGKNK
ncbi:ribosomal protein L2 [Allomyces macrogynus ATCC 38327]|uniref:Large ribosomal subunit protein uL2m n=1 Tax=Allomyces macrogynus (strain ATCC 38327) TaxID=578462 RepID=A0A0L0S173_ALLM3|nr:ribosomal protein L2 [Allomyces macrogynus ATCC 38327]|eukprot:KNE56337.1 ribosomal protein L2 [Allomyces macrogynus ATCC 38327]